MDLNIRTKIALVTLPCYGALLLVLGYESYLDDIPKQRIEWAREIEAPFSAAIYNLKDAFTKEVSAVLDHIHGYETRTRTDKNLELIEEVIQTNISTLRREISPNFSEKLRSFSDLLKEEDETREELVNEAISGKVSLHHPKLIQFRGQILKLNALITELNDELHRQRQDFDLRYLEKMKKTELLYRILLVLVLLLTLSLVLSTARAITQPIYRLVDAFKAIGTSEEQKSIESTTKDELAILVQGYNQLLESLAESRLKEAASSKMAVLGEFSAGIAHEVSTPLTIIMANLDRMNKRAKSESLTKEALHEGLDKIGQHIQHIVKVIKSLKVFSRSNTFDPPEPIQPEEVVDVLLGLVQEKLTQNQIELRVNTESDLNFLSYMTTIIQILLNFTNNAVDAMEKETSKWMALNISLSKTHPSFVKFEIINAGPKISPEIADKIMTPFFRLNPRAKELGWVYRFQKNSPNVMAADST